MSLDFPYEQRDGQLETTQGSGHASPGSGHAFQQIGKRELNTEVMGRLKQVLTKLRG